MVWGQQVTLPAHRKYELTKQQALEWARNYASAQNYLSKVSLQDEAAFNLWHFCTWANKTPDQLLKLKASFDSLDAERLLDSFVYSQVKLPESTKWHVVQAVRGFFTKNYRQLQAEAGRMEYVQVKPQRKPTKAQRLDLYRACYNPRDRALILMGVCSCVALETMSELCWRHFEDDWQRQDVPYILLPSALIKGHGRGRYRGVLQVPFVTPECKRHLVHYRDWYSRTFGYRWRESDRVFLSVRGKLGEPLTYRGVATAVFKVSRRAGVPFGLHDGRRIVQTALESVGVSPNWIKKIKGRKVRGEDAPYSKPAIEQLREKYREALGELEFLGGAGEGEAAGLTADDRRDLMAILRYMRENPEKFK